MLKKNFLCLAFLAALINGSSLHGMNLEEKLTQTKQKLTSLKDSLKNLSDKLRSLKSKLGGRAEVTTTEPIPEPVTRTGSEHLLKVERRAKGPKGKRLPTKTEYVKPETEKPIESEASPEDLQKKLAEEMAAQLSTLEDQLTESIKKLRETVATETTIAKKNTPMAKMQAVQNSNEPRRKSTADLIKILNEIITIKSTVIEYSKPPKDKDVTPTKDEFSFTLNFKCGTETTPTDVEWTMERPLPGTASLEIIIPVPWTMEDLAKDIVLNFTYKPTNYTANKPLYDNYHPMLDGCVYSIKSGTISLVCNTKFDVIAKAMRDVKNIIDKVMTLENGEASTTAEEEKTRLAEETAAKKLAAEKAAKETKEKAEQEAAEAKSAKEKKEAEEKATEEQAEEKSPEELALDIDPTKIGDSKFKQITQEIFGKETPTSQVGNLFISLGLWDSLKNENIDKLADTTVKNRILCAKIFSLAPRDTIQRFYAKATSGGLSDNQKYVCNLLLLYAWNKLDSDQQARVKSFVIEKYKDAIEQANKSMKPIPEILKECYAIASQK